MIPRKSATMKEKLEKPRQKNEKLKKMEQAIMDEDED